MALYDSLQSLQNYLFSNLGNNFSLSDVADQLKTQAGAEETDFYLNKTFPSMKADAYTMTGQEIFDFIAFYKNKYTIPMSQRIDIQAEYRRYFLLHISALLTGKNDFSGGTYGNDLFYEEIRPETYYAYYNPATSGSPTAPVKTFAQTAAATGWTKPWIEFNNNYDGSADTTSNPVSQLSDNVAMFLIGDLDASASPHAGQLQWISSDGAPQGIEGTNANYIPGALGLNFYKKSIYIGVNKRMSLDRSFISTGSLFLVPQGMQIVTKEYHTQE